MLRIRLQRSGRKKRPHYRVVVAEHSAPIQGRIIESLGSFDPLVEKHGFQVDTEKVDEWVKKGAKPTNTVARLLKGAGHKGMDAFIIEMKDRKVKNPKEAAAAPAASAEAPAEAPAAEETPAAEEAPAAEEKPAEEAPAEEEKKEEEAPAAEEEKPAEEPERPQEEEKPAEEAPAEEGQGEEEKSE